MAIVVNILLYAAGMGALLLIFLPFSPMTIDLLPLSRAAMLTIYRRRRWLWTLAGLSLGVLLLRGAAGTFPGAAAPGAIVGVAGPTWFWLTAASAALMAMMFWSGYVPYIMTPPKDRKVLAAAEADRLLRPESSVLGLVHEGEARAYPRDLIARPHYLNDRVGRTPFTISYCILCNSAVALKAEMGGRPLDLHSLTAFNNNIIYHEPARGNFIQQLDGKVIAGPDAGAELEARPLLITTWAEWKALHPDTKVLFAPPRGLRDRMVDAMLQWMIPIDKLARRSTPWHRLQEGELDTRLPAMSFVFGAEHGGERCAYPLDALGRSGVLQDELGGEPVVVLYDTAHDLGSMFSRRLDDRTLDFTAMDGRTDGVVARDEETGSLWDVHGACREGPLAGRRLRELPHFNKLFWFSWAAFKPGTRIHDGSGTGKAAESGRRRAS